ncbi:hypothetical protein ARMSODRAFT_335472 [Armillaria solidipes]|uniref:Uncharacterized protein n=1 Tax=Armillaria solidipes TaxID=1076256 RepID=A0A2H3BR10_9AGAR|nr:hypothetical protein ARMSODRAFT_335472 [Armillaria solidipes]
MPEDWNELPPEPVVWKDVSILVAILHKPGLPFASRCPFQKLLIANSVRATFTTGQLKIVLRLISCDFFKVFWLTASLYLSNLKRKL